MIMKVKSILVAATFFLHLSINAQSIKAGDQLAIRNAVAQWNQLQDDGNISAFMNLWVSTEPSFTNPFGSFKGKEAIQEFVTKYVGGFAKGKRHQGTNVAVNGSGNNAAVIEDLNVVEINDIPFIAATVRLNAALVKEKGEWKFKEVKLTIDPGFQKLQEKMKK
jgi:ketosteroid isomerase-like protein